MVSPIQDYSVIPLWAYPTEGWLVVWKPALGEIWRRTTAAPTVDVAELTTAADFITYGFRTTPFDANEYPEGLPGVHGDADGNFIPPVPTIPPPPLEES